MHLEKILMLGLFLEIFEATAISPMVWLCTQTITSSNSPYLQDSKSIFFFLFPTVFGPHMNYFLFWTYLKMTELAVKFVMPKCRKFSWCKILTQTASAPKCQCRFLLTRHVWLSVLYVLLGSK